MIINAKEKHKIEERKRECLCQWLCLDKALLRRWYLIFALKEVRKGAKWGKNVPDRGKSKWKGLEHGVRLVPLRYREEASMAGNGRGWERVVGDEVSKVTPGRKKGALIMKGSLSHLMDFWLLFWVRRKTTGMLLSRGVTWSDFSLKMFHSDCCDENSM